ncbi:hypothetical protein C8R44DRAFT_321522 [Mycena epipterygia]|nr:hypothetical protein C8R44DRAFT_321522 [Mycena epipterygia]
MRDWTSVLSPLLCGLISGIVQIFYALELCPYFRRFLEVTHVGQPHCRFREQHDSPSTCHGDCFAGTGTESCRHSRVFIAASKSDAAESHSTTSSVLVGSLVTDIIIAASMTWMLHTARFHIRNTRVNSVVNRIIMASIQTGALTVICAGASLALFARYTHKDYYFSPTYILAKLYSNMTSDSRKPQ